jgi:ankyrin repeat protein
MSNPCRSLFAAILEDDPARVKKLIRNDPRLSQEAATDDRHEQAIAHWIYAGDTALHVAAAGYRMKIAELLLAAGADAGAAGNRRRSQPLHYAADGYLDGPFWNPDRQVAMIRLLIDAGADIHAQDKNGATPLHRAVRTRCAAAVTCLLDAGGDATIENNSGSTPFHLAVQNTGRGGSGVEKAKSAQKEIIRAFLRRGVSTALRDRNGKSVLEWVTSDAIRELIQGNAS